MDSHVRCRSNLSIEQVLEIFGRIKTLIYKGHQIRVIEQDGQCWIVFSDICKALGYKNANHESKKVYAEEKRKIEIGLKNTLATCISERGLLTFSLFANKLECQAFREWADVEVFGNKRS